MIIVFICMYMIKAKCNAQMDKHDMDKDIQSQSS